MFLPTATLAQVSPAITCHESSSRVLSYGGSVCELQEKIDAK